MGKLQPKLRFPEFREELFKSRLGEIATFSKGKGISKNDITSDGKNECIRYGELYTTYGEVINQIVSKTNVSKTSSVLSEFNDIIIPSSGETQLDIAKSSCVLKSDVILGGDLNIIKTKNNGVFFSYYLNSAKKEEIAKMAQGNSVVHLYSHQLSSLAVSFPTLPEQNKIASFLTTVDEKIAGLKKQLTLLERYKKGVMQKIFAQELRFQDENGSDFPDWEKLAISQLFDSKKGSGLSKDKLSNNGKYKCLLYGELFTTYKEKITSIVSFTNSLEGVCVEENDILVPGSTTTSGIDLSKFSALKVSDVRVGGDVTILKSKKKIEPVFYAYYLSNFKKREIGNKAQGITIVHLSFSNFKDIIIDFPAFSEQQKIATFLSSIDEKLEKCQGQIKAMENWKKGLLQQMFV